MIDPLSKYRVPFYQADAGGEAAPAEAAPVVAEGASALAAAPEAAPVEAEPAPAAEKPAIPKGIIDELTRLRADRREADGRIAAAERQASEFRELAERLAQGKPEGSPAPAAPRQEQARGSDPDLQVLVRREAAAQRLSEARDDIIRNGYKDFGGTKFDEAANILAAMNCTTDDFITDVLAVDRSNAHKTLASLASDPENAARLARMDSRSRIAELTRMTMAAPAAIAEAAPAAGAKAPPKQVSRAPAPAPSVEPSASKVVDWRSDDVSDAEFSKAWDENQAKRFANRR